MSIAQPRKRGLLTKNKHVKHAGPGVFFDPNIGLGVISDPITSFRVLGCIGIQGTPNDFKVSAGVEKDPRTHVGVKIDPRNPFTGLFLGNLSKVKEV